MRSLVGLGIDWLDRLWPRSRPATEGPEPVVRPVLEALAALEARTCDALVHRPLEPTGAGRTDRSARPATPPRNAFGRPVREIEGSGAAGAVAAATGVALTGRRVSAFLRGSEIDEARPALRAAAERLAPWVLHVVGPAPLHDTGWFQLTARSGQHALDLTLLARWLAERALLPGQVGIDEAGLADLRLPDDAFLREWLGWPEDPLVAPTEAQRLVFGPRRPRSWGWFDPDRPMALGGARDAGEAARMRLGRDRFFAAHLRDLASEGMAALQEHTGRSLGFVDTWGVDRADRLIVAAGARVETARSVAEALARRDGLRVGVIGVTWLRPFPGAGLAALLRGRPTAVLDTPDAALHREVAAVAGGPRPTAALSAELPAPERLAALCRVLQGSTPPAEVWLDAPAPELPAGPRRQALDEAVAIAYPEEALSRVDLPAPPGFGVVVIGRETDLEPALPASLATALGGAAGPAVRGGVVSPEPGIRRVRVRVAAEPFPDPGPGAPADLLVIASPPDRLGPWPATVAVGGALWLVGEAQVLPPAWAAAVQRAGLRVATVPREGWLEAVTALAEGGEPAIDALSADAWQPGIADPHPPGIVRRIGSERRAPDSLPRFWGEQARPRHRNGGVAADPVTATGAVPALATALVPAPADGLPALDAEACTGCGDCWVACPDSALGPAVLAPRDLLDAASRRAGTSGRPADALRRAHKHLGSRVAKALAKAEPGAVPVDAWRDAYGWLVDKLGVAAEERPAWREAFEATLTVIEELQPLATEHLFHAPDEGGLLVWSVDPAACQGCGLCVTACPEDALALGADPSEARRRRSAWEDLPDTPGSLLAAAREAEAVGPMAGLLLSRHLAQAQVGGGRTDPGSGERLAHRLVAALAESHGQRRQAEVLEQVRARHEALASWLRQRLTDVVSGTAAGELADALEGGGVGIDLAGLAARLGPGGAEADRPALQRAAHVVDRLAEEQEHLQGGPDGLGRARFGVVAAAGAAVDALFRYPEHPLYAPVVVDDAPHTVDLARGVVEGLVADHLDRVVLLRTADLLVEQPADQAERLAALDDLAWEDLDAAERAACPPLILVADDRALLSGLGWLGRLLDGDRPVKVVLLDGLSLDRRVEPMLVALAHREVFCVAGSPAFPDLLARDLGDALAFSGPALVHLHAPSPARHGFAPDQTLAHARAAVGAGAHLLLRYDPRDEGVFGTRLVLHGPEAIDPDEAMTWALGQERFASRAGDPIVARWATWRAEVLQTLREIGGDAGPFADRLRSAIRSEVEAEHDTAIRAVQADAERRVAELQASRDREILERVTRRLMTLAGQRPDAGGEAS